jgi:hypothetical protein
VLAREEQVRGLDIAVDDPALVCVGEARADVLIWTSPPVAYCLPSAPRV